MHKLGWRVWWSVLAGMLWLAPGAWAADMTPVISCSACTTTPCTASATEGSRLTFTATNATGAISYTWDLNGDSTYGDATTATVSYTYRKPGSYTVRLRVTDGSYVAHDASMIVNITNAAPTARFFVYDVSNTAQYSEAYVYVGTTIDFHAEGSSDPSPTTPGDANSGISLYEWNWNYTGTFLTDYSSTTYTAYNAWTSTGDYTVALRVRDDDSQSACSVTPDDCAVTTFRLHVIPDGPLARIATPATAYYEGDTITLTDASVPSGSVAIVKWEWQFDYQASVAFTPDYTSTDSYNHNPSHAFNDARNYLVALRVTDAQGRSNTGYATVSPQNALPTATIAVIGADSQDVNGYYHVKEGAFLTLDASGSTCSPHPGSIVAYRWDRAYSSAIGFRPSAGQDDQGSSIRVTYDDDSAHLQPPNTPITVAVRAFDDDSVTITGSYGQATVQIWVDDVKPVAKLSGPSQLKQDVAGTFTVTDNSTNTDKITKVEWDFNFQPPTFNPSVTCLVTSTLSCTSTTHFWKDIQSNVLVAVRITDDDGDTSIDLLTLNIIDNPITAVISMKDGDTALGSVIDVNEGETPSFSAHLSQVPVDGRVVSILWDTNYSGTFTADSVGTSPACSSFKCTNASWISCSAAADCPSGNDLSGPVNVGDGTTDLTPKHCVAVCLMDNDGLSGCVEGNLNMAVMCLRVHNLPPVWKTIGTSSNNLVISVEDTYNYTYTLDTRLFVSDPAGQLDTITITPVATPKGTTWSNGRILTWKPSFDQIECSTSEAKVNTFTLRANDEDGGSADITFTIQLVKANSAPYIDQATDQAFPAGLPISYVPAHATDDDSSYCANANPTYQVTNISGGDHAWMNYDQNSGLLSGTPPLSVAGTTYTLHICGVDKGNPPLSTSASCADVHLTITNPQLASTCTLGQARSADPGKITLTAQVTSNPSNAALTYRFRQVGTDPASIYLLQTGGTSSATASFVASAGGTYTLSVACDATVGGTTTPGAESTVAITVNNLAPGVVLTGDRHFNVGRAVSLDASRSGDGNDGDTLASYAWSGDHLNLLDNATLAAPTFTTLDSNDVGAYTFSLVVTDNHGQASEARSFTGEVLDLANHVALPFAAFAVAPCDGSGCDAAKPAKAGAKIMLDASAAMSRPTGHTLTYAFSFLDGEATSINAGTYAGHPEQYVFTPPNPGLYHFKLTVTDGSLTSRPFLATVAVGSSGDGSLPVAAAGDNQKVTLKADDDVLGVPYAFVTLNGQGSSGGTLSYTWKQTLGLPVTLQDATTATPSFYAFAPGLYAFELSVKAGSLSSAASTTYVSVAAVGEEAPNVLAWKANVVSQPNAAVTLDGNVAAKDGVSYVWSQLSGPAIPLDSWDHATVTFTPDLLGVTYALRLVVWTAKGTPSLPYDVTVNALKESNAKPTCATAAATLSNVLGNTVTLDGSASHDVDAGQTLTYKWAQASGPTTGTLTDATKAVATFKPAETGTYTFVLTVNDGYEDCNPPASVTVTIGDDHAPIADAGDDISEACLGAELMLDGNGSSDEDGQPLTYVWSVVSGTAFGTSDLSSTTTATTTVTPTADGTVTVQLSVSDGVKTSSDTVEVTVIVCDCFDKDSDGYYQAADGGPCSDATKPWDCNDNDPKKNAGIAGSCDCVDVDKDGYGTGTECIGPDKCDDNPKAHTADQCKKNCIDKDGDGYGDGPDCLGPDCDDGNADLTTDCSSKGGGGGCQIPDAAPTPRSAGGALVWLFAAVAVLAAWRRLRARG